MPATESAPRRGKQVLCPVLVGRTAELAEIATLVSRAAVGGGGVVALAGEAGIGKSRLALESETLALQAGMTVLKGRAVAGAQPVPFRALAEALRNADRRLPESTELRPFLPSVRRLLNDLGSAADGEAAPLLLQEAVLRVLVALAGRTGLLLILEDAQSADDDTLAVLEYLGDHVDSEAVLIILTLRDDPGQARDLVEAMTSRRQARRINLRRLSATETAEMARTALGVGEVSSVLLNALVTRAEGVPFLVEEMLTAYLDVGRPAGIPQSYRDLVLKALELLDERSRRVLFAAAIIGRNFESSLLAEITGLSDVEVIDALRAAVRARLLITNPATASELPFEFRHALVRETIVGELLPPELIDLSARAAAAIESRHPGLPGDWSERVAELLEAAGDRAGAARHLQEAAQRAFVRGAYTSAEAMLEHARELVAGDRWHCVGIDRSLAEVLAGAGNVKRLMEVGSRAIAFMDEKRSTIMPSIFASATAGLHLRLAEGLHAAGQTEARNRHLEVARQLAGSDQPRTTAAMRLLDGRIALADGDLDAAVDAAHEVGALVSGPAAADLVAEAALIEGQVALRKGNLASAISALYRGLGSAIRHGSIRVRLLVELGAVEAANGDTTTLREALATAEAAGDIIRTARAEVLIGKALLRQHELARARSSLDRAIDLGRRFDLAVLDEAIAAESELRLVSGQQTPLTSFDALAAFAGPGVIADTVDRAAGATLSCDAVAFLAAVAALDRFRWFRYVTLRLGAEAATISNWGDPVAWLREALAFFAQAGNEPEAALCRAELRRAGAAVPRRGRGVSTVPPKLRRFGVTSREMDVLDLVRQGMRNREIAARLFMSPRTVEAHVQSLRRKLDVDNRARLIAFALERATQDAPSPLQETEKPHVGRDAHGAVHGDQ